MVDLISRNALVTKLSQGYWDRKLQQAKNDPCVIDAMIDWAIRIVKEMPLESPWHTGTPTEDGLYVVIVQKYVFTENNRRVFLVEKKDPYFWIRDGKGHLEYGDVLAWIPYVEEGEE